jgi:ADP-ribose pyrophosphatase YjhB (NUDIX family)
VSKIHRHPLLVTVICFSKGALFTIERKIEPYAGFFQLPESPVKRGESLESAATRTLKEASGLIGTKMKLIGIHDSLEHLEKTRAYLVSFLCMQWTGEPPLENCRWMTNWQSEQLAFEHNIMVLEADEVIGMANKSRLLYAVR